MEIAELRLRLLDSGLVDDLPTILSVMDGVSELHLRLDISQELGWFRGHFPGRPVLPGVVQIHWAALAAVARFGFREVPTAINRLKFKNVIVPPSIIELSIARPRRKEVAFSYGGKGKIYSEGRLVFEDSAQ